VAVGIADGSQPKVASSSLSKGDEMPAERLSMRQIGDVLRLCFAAKLPQRAVARSLRLS
jgi:hypothetical protein